MLQFDDYRARAQVLRNLIKEEFAATMPRNWRYCYTDLLPICEIRGLHNKPPPTNAVAYLTFQSKYASSENPGWDTHNENIYLLGDGSFLSDGYDRVLTRVLPKWMGTVSS